MNSSKNNKKQHEVGEYLQPKRQNQFSFLMQSLDRQKLSNLIEKQNCANQDVRYSIKIKPSIAQKSYMTSSTMVTPLVQTRERKQKQNDQSGILIETLVYKTKKYLATTQVLIKNPTKVQQKVKKQCVKTACELIEILAQIQSNNFAIKSKKQQSPYTSLNSTGNIVLGANKSLSSSFHSANNLVSSFNATENPNNFMKKIQNLQQEKRDLYNMISHHELANIKMFIQLNEGESQEIENYKKLLSSLFEKYRQLQKMVKKESQKSKLLQIKLNESLNAGCGKLCEMNTNQLKKKIVNLQQIINEQNDSLSLALDQLQAMKQKLSKFQSNRTSLIQNGQQKNKNKTYSRVSQFPSSDLSKSTYSELLIDQSSNRNHLRNNKMDTHSQFNNISIKPIVSTKPDDNLMKFLVTQAIALQSFIK